MYKPLIISSQLLSLFSGYIGALFFICVLTAVGNLGSFVYGKSYQLKTFPEGKLFLMGVSKFTNS